MAGVSDTNAGRSLAADSRTLESG